MKLLPLAIVLGIVVAGCGHRSMPPMRPATLGESSAARSLASAQSDFAFRLKDQILKGDVKGNFCFSPISLNLGLSLLMNGASAGSADTLKKALGYDQIKFQTVNDGNYALLASMAGSQLTVANSLWIKSSLDPSDDFSKTMGGSYVSAMFDGGDFGKSTVDQINSWADDRTGGSVPKLLDSLPQPSSLVLADILAFEAKWNTPFDPSKTKTEIFTLEGGKQVSVPMMHQMEMSESGAYGGVKFLRLPYAGWNFMFDIIIPPNGQSAGDFLKQLSADGLRKLLRHTDQHQVTISIPRFQFSSGHVLDSEMKGMGLSPLYQGIDLSGINSQLKAGISLTQIIQTCYLKVDEKGTQAENSNIDDTPAPKVESFVADRPFVFALEHRESGAIVLLGVVNDPSAGN